MDDDQNIAPEFVVLDADSYFSLAAMAHLGPKSALYRPARPLNLDR
jgi:hypothetical protein